MKSFFYNQTLSVTEIQTNIILPSLRSIKIRNAGNYDVIIDFEKDIDSESLIIPVGAFEEFNFSPLDIRLKCATGEMATVQIYGLRNEKV